MATDLRFRQIHMDFHTSEAIAGIGAAFDPQEFATTLARAHVDSVTCFARCHHGWIYYDTQTNPERHHPNLERDLLREQIAACHAQGIRVPIYTTVQWDHYTATNHPEWLTIDGDGRVIGTPPFEAGFYRRLCLNSPYVYFLKSHVAEIMETMPCDGLFFDIVQPVPCACRYCRTGMLAAGLDPADPQAREAFGVETVNRFKLDMTAFVRERNQECTIFYNAGHVGPRHRAVASAYSHLELESLPSGGWGYMHFPITARYARTLGLDVLGMTGKFHTSWGDFHSFKNQAALEFECFNMLAHAAKCSIGDQLHPLGRIDRHVYDLVGAVYAEVERKEPWCAAAQAIAEIGVLTPEEFHGGGITAMPPALIGVTRMLEEGGHQFDIIDSAADFSRYSVLILPDTIPTDHALAERLTQYLADGGALIASFESGLNPSGEGFGLEALGVRLRGKAPFSPDFLLPRGAVGRGLPETEHAMYMRGLEVEVKAGAEILADVVEPYFNRTYKHFCSHRHTPSAGTTGYPGIVQNGRAIYFAHPIFGQYNQNAPRWCRTMLLNALALLLPEPLARHQGPTTLRLTITGQTAQNRQIVHLLHYIPERRSQDIDIIEDVIPIYQVPISIRADGQVRSVTCVPSGETLAFEQRNGRVEFVVPEINGHQMIALQS